MARHLCEVPGCLRVTGGKYCGKHQRALSLYGDPLMVEKIEKSVPEDKEKFLQMALNTVTDECIFWKHDTLKIGVPTIVYNGKREYVFRVVCELVHGAPPSEEHEAAHSCGNGHWWCINSKHISWKTPGQNRADMVAHGTNGRKLTADDVLQIRKLSSGGMIYKDIASKFGIGRSHVSSIIRGNNWKWLK